MRCLILVGAELRQVRSALPYTLLTILSPVMFMALFMLMVRGDITLPLTVHPGPDRSEFAQVLATNRAPGNPPYLQVEPGTPICRSAAREAYESGCGSHVRPVGEKPAPGASPIHGSGMRQPSRPTWSRSERNQIGSWR